MGWPLDSTIRSQLSTFVKELLMGQEPVVHVKKVAYQRKQECAPRSMLDLFDILMHIARGGADDPHSLERDRDRYSKRQRIQINDDSDAFRTFIMLSILKCLDSAGLFDFNAARLRAVSDTSSRVFVLSSDEDDRTSDSSEMSESSIEDDSETSESSIEDDSEMSESSIEDDKQTKTSLTR